MMITAKTTQLMTIKGLSMNAQELSWTITEEKKQIWHKRPGGSRNLHPGAVSH